MWRPRLVAQNFLSIIVLLSAVKTVMLLRMLTTPKQHVREVGSIVELECQFYDDTFNLFDFPVVWHKKQHQPSQRHHHQNQQHSLVLSQQQQEAHHHSLLLQPSRRHRRQIIVDGYEDNVIDQINLTPFVTSENEEDCQINMMDTLPEDSANYTCQIDGPQNTIIGSVTHSVTITAPVEEIIVALGNWTTANYGVTDAIFGGHAAGSIPTVAENQPSLIKCLVIGGGPTTDIRVHVGGRELTEETMVSRSSTISGSKCMRRERFVVTRWSHQVELTSEDDLASVNCSVSVASGQLPVASRATTLYVKYAPIIQCEPVVMAEPGQMDVELTCKIQARPEVTALYWMIDSSMGVNITEGVSMSEYSTTNMVLSDSVLISKLHVRCTQPESFRTYTIFAENALAKESQDVRLRRRPLSFTTTPLLGENFPALPHVRGDLKRMAVELHNSALVCHQRDARPVMLFFGIYQLVHLWLVHV